ncbi:hypothetical protein Leryth_012173 [Lithospermum erythrorhizon]|uniref:Uncharacterized protein n=1 Tax=Lithospermum erythrorhizon TaxID=34254 RepID=A0AAV3R5T7_LITER|nr:hypothetical protein Leryth_012173 [Lithospermum erythrorhizon]
MASSCIHSCLNDTQAPVRATYVNLYKWPESDAEFIRSMSSSSMRNGNVDNNNNLDLPSGRVVNSISCRQLYLRSYTFSREGGDNSNIKEKTKCLKRVKKSRGGATGEDRRKSRSRGGRGGDGGGGKGGGKRTKCGHLRRVIKEVSCNALVSIFRKLLYCTTKVDIVN